MMCGRDEEPRPSADQNYFLQEWNPELNSPFNSYVEEGTETIPICFWKLESEVFFFRKVKNHPILFYLKVFWSITSAQTRPDKLLAPMLGGSSKWDQNWLGFRSILALKTNKSHKWWYPEWKSTCLRTFKGAVLVE
jgi:hypothetical protein